MKIEVQFDVTPEQREERERCMASVLASALARVSEAAALLENNKSDDCYEVLTTLLDEHHRIPTLKRCASRVTRSTHDA